MAPPVGARRWILPFSRELTLGALAQAPLLPWRWKMDLTHWWLKRYFYGPAGITHMMPGGGHKAQPRDNDYAGVRAPAPCSAPSNTQKPCWLFVFCIPCSPLCSSDRHVDARVLRRRMNRYSTRDRCLGLSLRVLMCLWSPCVPQERCTDWRVQQSWFYGKGSRWQKRGSSANH